MLDNVAAYSTTDYSDAECTLPAGTTIDIYGHSCVGDGLWLNFNIEDLNNDEQITGACEIYDNNRLIPYWAPFGLIDDCDSSTLSDVLEEYEYEGTDYYAAGEARSGTGNLGRTISFGGANFRYKIIPKDTETTPTGPPSLEFTVDSGIYDPPSTSNPYGKALDKNENPYNDGIVTYYDPLVCKLENVQDIDSEHFRVTGTKNYKSDDVECSGGVCSISIHPKGEPHQRPARGERLTCTASVGGEDLSAELTVAKHVFIFYPINQYHLGNARESYNKFLDLSEANKSPDNYVKPIYIKTSVPVSGYNMPNFIRSAEYVINNIYRGNKEYDKFISVHEGTSRRGLTEFSSHVIFIEGGSDDLVLAHELGHSMSNLCDEYDWERWENQDEELRNKNLGGCPNPIPEPCKNIFSSEPVTCRGMPYSDKNTPLPDSETALPDSASTARYYSIMGFGLKNVIYSKDATCPLRNC